RDGDEVERQRPCLPREPNGEDHVSDRLCGQRCDSKDGLPRDRVRRLYLRGDRPRGIGQRAQRISRIGLRRRNRWKQRERAIPGRPSAGWLHFSALKQRSDSPAAFKPIRHIAAFGKLREMDNPHPYGCCREERADLVSPPPARIIIIGKHPNIATSNEFLATLRNIARPAKRKSRQALKAKGVNVLL